MGFTPMHVAFGQFPGHSHVNKFGRNGDIDSATVETIWDVGANYNWMTQAQTLAISSDNINDAAAGTGARKIRVEGLDVDFEELSEEVTLNGLTQVSTVGEYRRCHRAYVTEAGTGGENAGAITIHASVDNFTVAQISPTYNQTLMAVYTVPDNYNKALLLSWYYAIERAASTAANCGLWVRPPGGVFQVKHLLSGHSQGATTHQHTFSIPLTLAPMSDIEVRADVTSNNCSVDAGFDLILTTTN